VDEKRIKDPVYKWELYSKLARQAQDDEFLKLAQANMEAAMREKANALPPTQRVDHLRKRLRLAEEELGNRAHTVEMTEIEIDKLQARLKLEVESRDDFYDKVADLRVELQAAEAQLPKPEGVRPVGRQVQSGDLGVVERLRELRELLVREAGGGLTSELSDDFDRHATAIAEMHQECREVKASKEEQMAEDVKLAVKLQAQELSFQVGSKHARCDARHDEKGDGIMADASAMQQAAEDEEPWQQQRHQKRRGKGSGVPTCPPASASAAATSSGAQLRSSERVMGPIATAPRGRSDERRSDRDRSPRRPKAAGTPAAAAEAGSLAPPAQGTPPGSPERISSDSEESSGGITPAVSSSLSSLSPRREPSVVPTAQATEEVVPPPQAVQAPSNP
jgi:hypothetical protein